MTEQIKLTLSISKIAPLIGLDQYNNLPKIFCEIWRKYNPVEFTEYEQLLIKDSSIKLVNSNEFNDILEIDNANGTNILQQLNTINDDKNKSSHEMVKQQTIITQYINAQDKFNAIQKTDLIKKVCSITNRQHGIYNENHIINEFCRLSEKVIQQEQGWVETQLNTSKLIQWVIIGKYDAITTENELLEVKMRQKGLFKKMRDYENVQVQLYLHALEYKKGYLVENFTNKKNEMQLYIHEIKYDEEYVNEIILNRLKAFVQFFENVMEDKSEHKKHILNGLLKGDINREIYKYYEQNYLEIEAGSCPRATI